MSFIIDKQTLDDLNIFGKRGKDSVYSLFNRTITSGGAERLEIMFRNPLSDGAAIHKRISTIRFFIEQKQEFLFAGELFETIGAYLEQEDERSRLSHDTNPLQRTFRKWMGSDTGFQLIRKGILSLVKLLQRLQVYLTATVKKIPADHPYNEEIKAMQQLLNLAEWRSLLQPAANRPSYETLIQFDRLLRFQYRDEVKRLLGYCYNMDVYIAIGKVANEKRFVFPEVLPQHAHSICVVNLYHPELKQPVSNSISFTPESNIIFLTGANMAGKSTFMKSFGIAIYLAHMGFPVPADEMKFSVRDGLLTTINLPDNLDMGYSHFYVEVLRVKKVVEMIKQGKNMVIMFDEMFRGTNVKDAYEATVAITGGFAKKRNCLFVVSTHIMEAGETLRPHHPNINFLFLPTRLQGNTPVYTRILEQGISSDRHGMIIIKNEGILAMLEKK